LNFKENSRKILKTLEFDGIWLTSSLLQLIARKNTFPAKEDKKIEIQSKKKIGLIS
jgi:hypothetical protein